jgi:hypothetical protein|nr:MAG TPA: hypothetical protein [Caudoviricetes sp.]
MIGNMRVRIFQQLWEELCLKRELSGLCEKKPFKDFVEFLTVLYNENLCVAEDKMLSEQARLRAIETLKIFDGLLDFFNEYKENDND